MNALDTFVLGLPPSLQEAVEQEAKACGEEGPYAELELAVVTAVQATYTYLMALEGKQGSKGGILKGRFGGWGLNTPAMQYSAKLLTGPSDALTTYRSRFSA